MKITRQEHGNAAYLAAWKAANPEQAKAHQAKYRAANREACLARVLKCQKRRIGKVTQQLAAYKVSKGCTDCGYNAHPDALHFDHLPGHAKRNGVSALRSHPWSVILAEIEKCEVVCANCHAVRTASRRTK